MPSESAYDPGLTVLKPRMDTRAPRIRFSGSGRVAAYMMTPAVGLEELPAVSSLEGEWARSEMISILTRG